MQALRIANDITPALHHLFSTQKACDIQFCLGSIVQPVYANSKQVK